MEYCTDGQWPVVAGRGCAVEASGLSSNAQAISRLRSRLRNDIVLVIERDDGKRVGEIGELGCTSWFCNSLKTLRLSR